MRTTLTLGDDLAALLRNRACEKGDATLCCDFQAGLVGGKYGKGVKTIFHDTPLGAAGGPMLDGSDPRGCDFGLTRLLYMIILSVRYCVHLKLMSFLWMP